MVLFILNVYDYLTQQVKEDLKGNPLNTFQIFYFYEGYRLRVDVRRVFNKFLSRLLFVLISKKYKHSITLNYLFQMIIYDSTFVIIEKSLSTSSIYRK